MTEGPRLSRPELERLPRLRADRAGELAVELVREIPVPFRGNSLRARMVEPVLAHRAGDTRLLLVRAAIAVLFPLRFWSS